MFRIALPSEQMPVSLAAVDNQQLGNSDKCDSGHGLIETVPYDNGRELPAFDIKMNAWREYLGWYQPALGCSLADLPPSALEKTTIINDLHTPFHRMDVLAACIKEEAATSAGCFVAGDLSDLWTFARWAKKRRITNAKEELSAIQQVLVTLSESFRWVRIMSGNHDERFRKNLANLVPIDVIEYFDQMCETVLHPIAHFVRDLPNVEMIEPVHLEGADFGWIHQIGDAIVTHAEVYSKIPNRAVGNVVHYLKSVAEPEGLVKPFRCVLQGHTHQAGKTWCDYGVVGIELGCMSQYQEYHADAKAYTARPLVRGWTNLYQDATGRTDLRRTNFIPFKY